MLYPSLVSLSELFVSACVNCTLICRSYDNNMNECLKDATIYKQLYL